MASETVTVTRPEDGIALVRMDDPEQRNLLSEPLLDGLIAALRELSVDTTVKAAILCGRRDVFCGGGSLELLRSVVAGATLAKDVLLPTMLVEFPVPIIAALEGHAVGAGLAVALCCDITVASESARYGMNFTSMGFTPGLGVTSVLPALVGYGFAAEMMMTAKLYKGREFAERRLFTHVLPEGEVLGLAVTIAQRIAERPRHILTMLKTELALPRRHMLASAMAREHVMHEVCFSRPEARALVEEGYVGPRPEGAERGTER